MHTLVSLLPKRLLILQQLPALLVSILIAELFYKFHSFTLECLAFLATWYLIDAGIKLVDNLWERRQPPENHS